MANKYKALKNLHEEIDEIVDSIDIEDVVNNLNVLGMSGKINLLTKENDEQYTVSGVFCCEECGEINILVEREEDLEE